MTKEQVTELTKKADELRADFFKEDNHGLEFIYDRLLELPSLISSYQSQIGDKEYEKIKDQLAKYKAALKSVRELNKIDYVFS